VREGFRLEGSEVAETVDMKLEVRSRDSWMFFVRSSSVSSGARLVLPSDVKEKRPRTEMRSDLA
jgi:hypothetical protein